jgi:hypothetical protein
VGARSQEWVRPVVLTWLLLGGLSVALLLRATFSSPPGTVFVGTFSYVDDFYNYLSYVQQAEDGALVFRNKLVSPDQPPALVNIEWLVVGWLSALLGGRPLVAYRVVGLLALGGLVFAVERWLVRGGLPPTRRLSGLLLVFSGGGLGWFLVAMGNPGGRQPWDLIAGLYPFIEALANPHFVVGTALVAASLAAFAGDRPRLAVALGTLVALVRPYDAGLVLGVETLAVLLLRPRREWPRRLATAAALLPALAYDTWVFLWSPGFRVFSSSRYATSGPSATELALALGPGTALALLGLRPTAVGDDGEARRYRIYLSLWAGLALAIVVVRPVSFSLQFGAGVGVPLLTLAAIGLGRMRRGVLEAAIPLLAGTAVTYAWLQVDPNTYRNVPAERWRVATALRTVCRRGELVVAPPDIGLYVGGLSSCWPWVSHSFSPAHNARDQTTRRLYSASPRERGRLLEEICATHVVVPATWAGGGLPAGAPYERRLEVEGMGGGLAVYSRVAGSGCQVRPPRPPAAP